MAIYLTVLQLACNGLANYLRSCMTEGTCSQTASRNLCKQQWLTITYEHNKWLARMREPQHSPTLRYNNQTGWPEIVKTDVVNVQCCKHALPTINYENNTRSASTMKTTSANQNIWQHTFLTKTVWSLDNANSSLAADALQPCEITAGLSCTAKTNSTHTLWLRACFSQFMLSNVSFHAIW